MMSTLSHPLVTDYLDRLRAESVRLPADQASDLVADIRDHFASALGDAPTESQVRETIDRLGEPAELVDAAGGSTAGGPGAPGAVAAPAKDTSGREAVAAALLVGAALFFVVWFVSLPMWVAGLVMVALAQRWTAGEKLLALASWGTLLPVAWVVMGAGFAAFECSDAACTPPPGNTALLIGSAIVGVLYLAFVAWASWRLVRGARR